MSKQTTLNFNYILPEPTRHLLNFLQDTSAPVPDGWEVLAQQADEHGLAAWFCQRVLNDDAGAFPPEAVTWCQARVWGLKMRGVAISHAITAVQRILAAAGIETIWLKGAALAHWLYPAFWMRQMVDVDVLVPFDQREKAFDVMEAAGYQPVDYVLPNVAHHYVFLESATSQIPVEVHYHLTAQAHLPLNEKATAWFWEQTTRRDTSIGDLRMLKPEAMLLHLAAHDILHHDLAGWGDAQHLDAIKLSRKYDVHLLVAHNALDWALVKTQAEALGWELAVIHALAQAHYLFNTPVPGAVLAAWDMDPAQARAFRPHQDRQQLFHLGTLRRLPWRDKPTFAWQVMFPPRTAMRQLYELGETDRVWPHYVKRLGYLAWRLVRLLLPARLTGA